MPSETRSPQTLSQMLPLRSLVGVATAVLALSLGMIWLGGWAQALALTVGLALFSVAAAGIGGRLSARATARRQARCLAQILEQDETAGVLCDSARLILVANPAALRPRSDA